MDNNQINKYNMYQTVQRTLDDQSELWTAIPIFVRIKNQFDALLSGIEEQNAAKQIKTQEFTKNKNQLKEQLVKKAGILSGILVSYASIENNPGLMEKVSTNKSELLQAREALLPDMIQGLINEAQNNLAALADYGYTQDQLTELSTSLDDFRPLIGTPRQAQTKISVAIKSLEELFSQVDEVLKNQMDKLMLRFSESESNFYQTYLKARVIVDR